MEWDTSHWYNFQHSRVNLKPFDNDKIGVLVAGSSVALYSALPSVIEEGLNERGLQSSVRFYSHVAMSPSDLYRYTEDIVQKNPKVVLYLLNPADFQLDYFPVNEKESFEFNQEPCGRASGDRAASWLAPSCAAQKLILSRIVLTLFRALYQPKPELSLIKIM
jgi:hypothetical protein